MATGKQLQAIREAADIKQQVLAFHLGTYRWAVSQLEQREDELGKSETKRYIAALQRAREQRRKKTSEMIRAARESGISFSEGYIGDPVRGQVG